MKRIIQLLAVASLGLGFVSCDKSDDLHNGKQVAQTYEPQRFELNSSLGIVGVQALSSNTDLASEDDLRATLHFNGLNSAATTTLNPEKYGLGKRDVRWGVIYDGGKYKSVNCEEAVSEEPANPNNLEKSTAYFKKSTATNTIEGASIKMYCQSLTPLKNITKGFMVLEGKAGSGSDVTNQYYVGNTSPNDRIEPLTTTISQEGRHIPIMTEVVDIEEMQKPLAANTVKFAPRGSLIGLNIKNRIDTDIIVTAVVVEKAGALDYSGYFDWKTLTGNKASFVPMYPTSQVGTAVSFPVYANKDVNEVGYTITKDNTTLPCFYIWGFQKAAKVGEAFQVQLRYKTSADGEEQTTRTFNVYAPQSKVVAGTKQFDDGYSYNVTLTINSANKTGGSNGKDWNNGGTLDTDVDNTKSYSISLFRDGQAVENLGTDKEITWTKAFLYETFGYGKIYIDWVGHPSPGNFGFVSEQVEKNAANSVTELRINLKDTSYVVKPYNPQTGTISDYPSNAGIGGSPMITDGVYSYKFNVPAESADFISTRVFYNGCGESYTVEGSEDVYFVIAKPADLADGQIPTDSSKYETFVVKNPAADRGDYFGC